MATSDELAAALRDILECLDARDGVEHATAYKGGGRQSQRDIAEKLPAARRYGRQVLTEIADATKNKGVA